MSAKATRKNKVCVCAWVRGLLRAVRVCAWLCVCLRVGAWAVAGSACLHVAVCVCAWVRRLLRAVRVCVWLCGLLRVVCVCVWLCGCVLQARLAYEDGIKG